MRQKGSTYITELLVHLEDLICDLGACDHGALSNLLEDAAREEDQLLVLLLLLVILIVGALLSVLSTGACSTNAFFTTSSMS